METDRQRDNKSLSTRSGQQLESPVLSVCIVTYRARDVLRGCLSSLYENTYLPFETIVVDNGSNDGTIEMLQTEFPDVQVIKNFKNLGFTLPMNQALKQAKGHYLLQLNPDTVILPGAFDILVDFLEQHPEIGICGPKVLNRDLSLQKPCRRGEPTPWAVITYFTGLSNIFPDSKLFGQYLMSYLDENQTQAVDGVSGSCMLIRKEVIDEVGYLDEIFFAYQEDADFCLRTRQGDWTVFYVAESQIIHYGSMGGSRVEPYRSIIEWHRSYYLYYRKNLAGKYFFIFNWIYYVAMLFKLGSSLLINLFREDKRAGSRKP